MGGSSDVPARIVFERGQMSSLPGCIVHTPGTNLAYKVLLIYRGQTDTEHAFATMREAEAFLRSNTASGSPTRPSTDT